MTQFLQEVLAYASGRTSQEIGGLAQADLAEEMFGELHERPYLIVLDGFERLLAAYSRWDPSTVSDSEAGPEPRSLTEPNADAVVRRLAGAGPSKVLISTRLMPVALQGRFSQGLPGVRRLSLDGLTDDDTQTCWHALA